MSEFILIPMLMVATFMYIGMIAVQSFSLWITLLLWKKLKKLKIKKIDYKRPLYISFQVLGIHYLFTLLFVISVSFQTNKILSLIVVFIFMIVTILLLPYLIWLIKKTYSLSWTYTILIYFVTGLFATIIFYLIYGIVYLVSILGWFKN